MAIGLSISSPEQTAYLQALVADETEYQADILQARMYHDGRQFVALTDRLRAFLGGDVLNTADDWKRLRLNVCRIVLTAVLERLSVTGFESDETADAKPVAAWAWQTWQKNRMDAKQRRAHEAVLRDSEAFVIVDWDNLNKRPRFTPHDRYIDASVGGDNAGCKAFYRNDDPDQDLLYVTKRWAEVEYTKRQRTTRQRLTVYYPDRIEKFAGTPGAWKPVETVVWRHRDGTPLGIPVAHGRSSAGMEAREAWPLQNAINKVLVDLMRESDMSAFRILVAFGWKPVDKNGRPLTIEPGTWVGSESKDASLGEIKGSDLSQFLNVLDALIYKVATVTDTPVSRFIATKQIAAEGSQKEQGGPLLNKARARAGELGNMWEDALHIARRLENTFGAGGLDEAAQLSTTWDALDVRDEAAELKRAETYDRLGVPLEIIAGVLGFTPAQTAAWQAEKDARRALAQTIGQTPQQGQQGVQADEQQQGGKGEKSV